MIKPINITTTKGLQAPVRSLTDSMLLPEGSLVKAKNCTFLPNQYLALWRPLFVDKGSLVENEDETVVMACVDCGYLAFVTFLNDTYRFYLYETEDLQDEVFTVGAVATIHASAADCGIAFGGGYAFLAIEGESPVMVHLTDKAVYRGGSILYTEASSSPPLEISPYVGQEALITKIEVDESCVLSKVLVFLSRSEPDVFGKGVLVVYVNGIFKAASIDVAYYGSLPDKKSTLPSGESAYYPVEFQLGDDVPLAPGDVVEFKLKTDDLTPSFTGETKLYVEKCLTKKEFLGHITGSDVHIHVNGTHHPKGGFCVYGQGRVFIAEEKGDVYSSDPLFPGVFDGFVRTGLQLVGLACKDNNVLAFSECKCSIISGTWPDMLEGVDEKAYKVSGQHGLLFVEDTLFLSWGGTLSIFGGKPILNPFVAEPTVKATLCYYRRLNLLVMALQNEGIHVAYQLNGLMATTWEINEVYDGELITIFGDYALFTNGHFYELSFESFSESQEGYPIAYEVEVLTKAVNCGMTSQFDRMLVHSGCNGPGSVTLLYCCDCPNIDGWSTHGAMLPYSQWKEATVRFPSVSQEENPVCEITFGSGLATAVDNIAALYRHPINCFTFKDCPSGWAVAVDIKLDATAPKSIGTLLGGFSLSVTNQQPRIGFAV